MSNLKTEIDNEVASFGEEYAKFSEKGNKAAATRARKHLLNIRNLANDLRKEIISAKK